MSNDLTPIPGFEGYFATRDGRIFSARRFGRASNFTDPSDFKELRFYINPDGYSQLCIPDDTGRKRSTHLHKLMMLAYGPPKPTPHHEIRHLDGNPQNNKVENLVWGTSKDNTQDSLLHGTFARGGKNGMSKLTKEDVYEIRRRRATGEELKTLAASYNMSISGVHSVASGINWSWLPEEGVMVE